MSDSVWPHRRQPTRLPRPWDSPARTLEWVAISFSNAWKWKVKVKSLSRVWLLATPWTAAYQAPTPMWFSRQEYWNGLPLPSQVHHKNFPQRTTNSFNWKHQQLLSSTMELKPKIPALFASILNYYVLILTRLLIQSKADKSILNQTSNPQQSLVLCFLPRPCWSLSRWSSLSLCWAIGAVLCY